MQQAWQLALPRGTVAWRPVPPLHRLETDPLGYSRMTAEFGASSPTFPQAMERAAQGLALWEAGELSDEVLADQVAHLVHSRDGARGFFVVSLSSDSALMDRPPEPLVLQLRQAGEAVVDLTVRNLAMSTAMALHHQRSGDATQQARSERVRDRSTELLRQLDPNLVKERLEVLLQAAGQACGPDLEFLHRWGYDPEQCRAISEAVLAVAE